jgi:hypothetical protein
MTTTGEFYRSTNAVDPKAECPICYEPLDDTPKLKACGHRIHLRCLEKHFKAECPICRTPQTEVVPKGEVPVSRPPPDNYRNDLMELNLRSRQYTEQIYITFPTRDYHFAQEDKEFVEQMLTRRANGEKLSLMEQQALAHATSRLRGFKTYSKRR